MPKLLDKKNADMLIKQSVFTKAELESRCEIMLENYVKAVNIEALTMADMARKEILPAIEAYVSSLAKTALRKKELSESISSQYEKDVISKLSSMADLIYSRTGELEEATSKLKTVEDIQEQANYIRDEILPKMSAVRVVADEAETMTDSKFWPFPTYGDLLFGVR